VAETAAHLTDQVLPRAPVHQWVLLLPKRARWFKAQWHETVSFVLRISLRGAPDNAAVCEPQSGGETLFSLRLSW
jgi:hypothetical protein